MANHPKKFETKDVREAFAALIRETIPPERIAQAISDGIAATETKFFSHEGKVEDSREVVAWSERRQYAELAAEYGGYHMVEKNERGPSTGVILILPEAPKMTAVDGATVIPAQPPENRPTLLLPDDPGEADDV